MKTEQEIRKMIKHYVAQYKAHDDGGNTRWACNYKLIADTLRTVIGDELVGFTSGEEYLQQSLNEVQLKLQTA